MELGKLDCKDGTKTWSTGGSLRKMGPHSLFWHPRAILNDRFLFRIMTTDVASAVGAFLSTPLFGGQAIEPEVDGGFGKKAAAGCKRRGYSTGVLWGPVSRTGLNPDGLIAGLSPEAKGPSVRFVPR